MWNYRPNKDKPASICSTSDIEISGSLYISHSQPGLVNFTSDNGGHMNPINLDGKVGGLAIYLSERNRDKPSEELLRKVEVALRAYKPADV